MGGRVPPHNLEAEASVIGSLMLDRNAIVRIADFLRPEDFYLDHHAQVYRAALNLYDRSDPIDLLTLAAELETMRVLERTGGQAFLAELQSSVPTAANVEYYGHLIEEAATKRKLITAGGRITALGFDEGTPAGTALDTAESVIFNIAEGRITQDFVALKDILKNTWDQIEAIHKDQSTVIGVPSGFNDLDAKTGGFQKSDLIIIAARPGVGKCVRANSLIDDPVTGARLTIEQYVQQCRPIVFGLSPRGRIESRHIGDWVDSGVQPCFAVTTQTGRRIEVTGHHPFMTISGWQPLYDLVVGDAIAVPRSLNIFGKELMHPQMARLLGYFVGDGGLSRGTPAFTNVDNEIIDDFISTVHSHFPTHHVVKRGITYHVSAWHRVRWLAVKERVEKYLGRSRSPVIAWLRQYSLWGKKAGEKRFPDVAWRWNRETLREFLRALMSCDGSIFATANGRPRIEFAVASEGLAKDVHHAFVRFGIVSRFYKKSERCWRVQITDSDSVARYQKEIGWIGEKARRFTVELPLFRSNNGHLPAAVWKTVRRVASTQGLGWSQLAVLSGERPSSSKFETYNARTNHGLSQRRLAIFNGVLHDARLTELANPEIYWDRIVSIEAIGRHRVYDLSVPDGANFIAEDVIVHNTSLTLNIAQHASIQYKIPVAIFSLEMSEQQLVTRLLCSEASVDSYRLRTGLLKDAEWPRIAQAMGALSEAQIYIDDSPNVSVMEMRTKARRLKSANNLGLIIVDYLQLMQGRNAENRVQEVSDISRSLKSLARELQIPIIACSQLSREPEKRIDHRPQLADLRESGCLAADTPIYLPDIGMNRPISDLAGRRDFRVLALNTNTWKLEPRAVTNAFSTGRKKVFRLVTGLGHSIRATGNHKFLTLDGWRRLDELAIGTYLAIPADLRVPALATAGLNESWIEPAFEAKPASSEELPRRAENETRWDAVTLIIPDGEAEVYDLTVDGLRNFVAGNIVAHNSLEQDADVVLFIYRERFYNDNVAEDKRNLAEIIIAKHRNGPTGKIELLFIDEQTKFANLDRRRGA
jgi:replicative DNA helicase